MLSRVPAAALAAGAAASNLGSVVSSVDGVTGDVTLANLTAFIKSLGTSGYQKLPGGLIIQWGWVSNGGGAAVGVTFPIAFPNACINVQATMQVNAGGSSYVYASKVQTYSASGATIYANNTFFWLAIGY